MIFLISLIGLAAMIMAIPMMFREAEQRRQKAIRQMHTRLVALNFDFEDNKKHVDLMSTYMIIGRWKRRCDISLEHLCTKKKRPISRIHAELWWDGTSFRIAPVYTRWSPQYESRPKVWVDGCLAPEHAGLEVKYGAEVLLSDARYAFKLEDTSKGEAIHATAPRPSANSMWILDRLQDGIDQIVDRIGRKPRRKPRSKPRQKPRPSRRTGRKVGRKLLIVLIAIVLILAVLVGLFLGSITMPQAESSLGARKKDTATILICGVDDGGYRTDTMILVYISGSEGKMSLLSLPRDTFSVSKTGTFKRLNAIYGGLGEEGAEDLLDVVENYVGYRPDGYMFFDWALVKEITDLMGGVTVTLDKEVSVTDPDSGALVTLPAGEHHLNGIETLATVRFRAGYVNADLGRVQVQRKVIKACKEQWIAWDHVDKLDDAVDLLMKKSMTNLTPSNLLWIAKTALNCEDMSVSETLAGHDEYRSGASYYILDPKKIPEQINANFNPYKVEITSDMLETVG